MTTFQDRPRPKNPVVKTRQATLPPGSRSRTALAMTAAAAEGRFELQTCAECGCVQYPPREACHRCLSAHLTWQVQDGAGELLSTTTLHHSNDMYFRERLPWRLGMVRLDAGPSAMVHVHDAVADAPCRIEVQARLDRSGQAVLVAVPQGGDAPLRHDQLLHETSSHPRHRRILISDGYSPAGIAMALALLEAGAERIWMGVIGGDDRAVPETLRAHPRMTPVPLDLSDAKSAVELAGAIGGKVDIVIHNALVAEGDDLFDVPVEKLRRAMELQYFGMLRLAKAFSPVLRGRAGDGMYSATAWVSLLDPRVLDFTCAADSALVAQTAAHSLTQCLRAELATSGIRVVGLYRHAGTDSLGPQLVQALTQGVEEAHADGIPSSVIASWSHYVHRLSTQAPLAAVSHGLEGRAVLVTDAKSEIGQAVVRALAKGGAKTILAGFSEPWKRPPGFDAVLALPQVRAIELDLTDSRALQQAANRMGPLDAVINTAEIRRAYGISNRQGIDTARAEMDINCLGLLRLARALFAPLAEQSAGGSMSRSWVNIQSVYALSNYAAYGSFSASKAAAFALSRDLRQRAHAQGIRMVDLFPGPIDDEWNQQVPPPKVGVGALAQAAIRSLFSGDTQVFVGDVAQEWRDRWMANPKTLERELALHGI